VYKDAAWEYRLHTRTLVNGRIGVWYVVKIAMYGQIQNLTQTYFRIYSLNLMDGCKCRLKFVVGLFYTIMAENPGNRIISFGTGSDFRLQITIYNGYKTNGINNHSLISLSLSQHHHSSLTWFPLVRLTVGVCCVAPSFCSATLTFFNAFLLLKMPIAYFLRFSVHLLWNIITMRRFLFILGCYRNDVTHHFHSSSQHAPSYMSIPLLYSFERLQVVHKVELLYSMKGPHCKNCKGSLAGLLFNPPCSQYAESLITRFRLVIGKSNSHDMSIQSVNDRSTT